MLVKEALTDTKGVKDANVDLKSAKATVSFDSLGVPLTLLTADGKSEKVTLPGSGDPVDAFVSEMREVVQSIERNKPSPILDGKLGRDALAISLSEEEAVKSGREVVIPVA